MGASIQFKKPPALRSVFFIFVTPHPLHLLFAVVHSTTFPQPVRCSPPLRRTRSITDGNVHSRRFTVQVQSTEPFFTQLQSCLTPIYLALPLNTQTQTNTHTQTHTHHYTPQSPSLRRTSVIKQTRRPFPHSLASALLPTTPCLLRQSMFVDCIPLTLRPQ